MGKRAWPVYLLAVISLVVGVTAAGAAVVVTSPLEGQTVHKTTTVEFTCDRSEGSVNISLDERLLAAVACTSAPTRFPLDVSSLSDGAHQVTLTELTSEGRTVSTVVLNLKVQNSAPAEVLQNGVSLVGSPMEGTYQVLVAGLMRIEGTPDASLPEALKTLDYAVRADVTEILSAPLLDGVQSAERRVDSGFVQRFEPKEEKAIRLPLADAGQAVTFMVGAEGLPRLTGAEPFMLGLPTLPLPGVQARIGYTWSAPMLTVMDLITQQLVVVDAKHRLMGFDWIKDTPCAVIESTWERSGPVTAVLWDRPFTFSKVRSSGSRKSYYAYERGMFLAAQEQIRHKVSASPQETQALRAIVLSSKLRQITEADFAAEVLQSPVPVLVEFMTDWCPHCKEAEEPLKATAKDYAGRAKVVLVNTETNPNLGAAYASEGVPDLRIFVNGQPVWHLVSGFDPVIVQWWRQALDQVLAGAIPGRGPTPQPTPGYPTPAPVIGAPVYPTGPAVPQPVAPGGVTGGRREKKEAYLPADLVPEGAREIGQRYVVAESPAGEGGPGVWTAVFQGGKRAEKRETSVPGYGYGATPTAVPAAPTAVPAAPAYPGAPVAPAPYRQPGVTGAVVELTDQNLYAAITTTPQPLWLYLYTQANPDAQLQQALSQVAASYAGALVVGRIALETNPQAAQAYAPDGQPSFVVFSGGRPLSRIAASVTTVQTVLDYLVQQRLIMAMPGVVQPKPLEFTYLVETVSQVR